MVFLRARLAVLAAALLFSGCRFDPAVDGLGYQECDTTDECMAGGMVCLKGFCVPDCDSVYTVSRLGPDSKDDAGEHFTWMCPGGRCEITGEYLDVELPPGTFLEMGSDKVEDQLGDCDRVVIRFSILAPQMDSQGRELSVVIRGRDATGVIPGTFTLEKIVEEQDLGLQFREQTQFYVVDVVIFGWPVRLRLVPIANNTTAFFWIRDFEMSCCN
jgi:hypothetical protein